MDPFDIIAEKQKKCSGACAECRAREGCNDMFKDKCACRELKRKEKKDAGNKRQS